MNMIHPAKNILISILIAKLEWFRAKTLKVQRVAQKTRSCRQSAHAIWNGDILWELKVQRIYWQHQFRFWCHRSKFEQFKTRAKNRRFCCFRWVLSRVANVCEPVCQRQVSVLWPGFDGKLRYRCHSMPFSRKSLQNMRLRHIGPSLQLAPGCVGMARLGSKSTKKRRNRRENTLVSFRGR